MGAMAWPFQPKEEIKIDHLRHLQSGSDLEKILESHYYIIDVFHLFHVYTPNSGSIYHTI